LGGGIVTTFETQRITGYEGVTPTAPGEPVKFVVVDAYTSSRSSTWRVWTGKRRDDVFLCEVVSGSEWKLSHHNVWGRWRLARTQEAAARAGEERQVIGEWPRAEQQEQRSEGVSVLVPCSDLRAMECPMGQNIVQVPTSSSYSGVFVRFFFEEAGESLIREVSDSFPVGVLVRPNGGCVYVVAQPMSLSRTEHETLEDVREYARRCIPSDTEWRRFVGVVEIERQPTLVDLALD
jgi:hypothetical protein